MRKIYLSVFLTVIIVGFTLRVNAQNAATTCDGSLGDPVVTQNFGSGTANPGPALSSQYTTMSYTTGCPNDGQYTIINSLNNSNNCHTDTWQNVLTDHTGNPNGYMMLINATQNTVAEPGVFFTEPVPIGSLCPNTTYEFSAYILNLIKYPGNGAIKPNITFSVTTTDGTPLITPVPTGDIPENNPANPADSAWKKYALFFTTPSNVTSVIVSMTNNANGGNGNDLMLDDITFRACGPVIQTGFTSINNTTTPTLCEGYTGTYTLVASASTPNPAYQWQTYNNATSSWLDIAGANASSYPAQFVNASAGTYQYRVGIANGSAISSVGCRVYSTPLTITVEPNPVVTGTTPTQGLCEGNTLTLAASGGVNYLWTKPDNTTTTTNPLVINAVAPTDAGNYSVTAYNQYGCASVPVSTAVTVYPKVTAAVQGDGTTICSGDNTVISASGGTSYLWSPGNSLSDSTSASPTAHPSDTTTYTVKVSNANGCSDTKTVTINVQKSPIANAGTDKVIFEGQSVQLTASEKYGSTYSWSPVTALSDPTILNPIASPVDDITYTLTVNSADGCGTANSSVFVKVYKKITIPNTFSPNGDGVNDYWDIDALITYPDCVLSVFDRYGQQVYHSIGYSKPWNGKYNGQLLPTGTYYYVLDLKNNTPKISGWVLIVR
jgi:gliding motility-associated-like protein